MNELRENIKSKNFVINPLILKNLNKIDISLNEFLLILYFINIKNSLDLENIKSYLGFNKEEILNLFNSLIGKSFIEIVMTRNGGSLEEEVSLEIFYDKLIMNIEEKPNNNIDIFTKFESEFGRTLSPIEYETINKWLENKINEETIFRALKEAVLNGVTNLRYIDKILYEWTKKSSKESVSKVNENSNGYKELFDYDWLGSGDNE